MGYNYSDIIVMTKVDNILNEIFKFVSETLSGCDLKDVYIKLARDSNRELYLNIMKNGDNIQYYLIYNEVLDPHRYFLDDAYKNKPRLKYTIELSDSDFRDKYPEGIVCIYEDSRNKQLFNIYEEVYKHLIMTWNEPNTEYPYSVKDIILNYKDSHTNFGHLDGFQV